MQNIAVSHLSHLLLLLLRLSLLMLSWLACKLLQVLLVDGSQFRSRSSHKSLPLLIQQSLFLLLSVGQQSIMRRYWRSWATSDGKGIVLHSTRKIGSGR
jgi:hypothetical protein